MKMTTIRTSTDQFHRPKKGEPRRRGRLKSCHLTTVCLTATQSSCPQQSGMEKRFKSMVRGSKPLYQSIFGGN